MVGRDISRNVHELELVIQAFKKAAESRSPTEQKILTQYVRAKVPLMHGNYCSKDDYAHIAERLQYKFVPRGHYVVRQGEKGGEVYNIVMGSCKVVKWGSEDSTYLDRNGMYNECALLRARTKPAQAAKAVAEEARQLVEEVTHEVVVDELGVQVEATSEHAAADDKSDMIEPKQGEALKIVKR